MYDDICGLRKQSKRGICTSVHLLQMSATLQSNFKREHVSRLSVPTVQMILITHFDLHADYKTVSSMTKKKQDGRPSTCWCSIQLCVFITPH